MGFEQVKPALNSYLSQLKTHINISQAFVFGSIAEGKSDPESDIDLLILSDDFSKFDEDERQQILYRASVGFPYDLHVYGLTPQEFHSASPLTALGALHRKKTISIS